LFFPIDHSAALHRPSGMRAAASIPRT